MPRMRPITTLLVVLLSAGLVAGCGRSVTEIPPVSDTIGSAVATPAAPAGSVLHVGTYKVAGSETVVVTTNKGAFTIELYPDKAPNTVSSFLELVGAGFYDGIRVHRIEPGFVVQAGDPQTKGLTAQQVQAIVAGAAAGPQLGTGGPGWKQKAEFNDLKHDRGVVAMARSSDPDSAGSQFYVTLGPANFLDGQYTVFGRVIKGMEVVDKLAVGDVISSAKIVTGD